MSDHFLSTSIFVAHATDLSAQQKAAKITYLMMHGGEYSVRQVADMFAISKTGANRLLENVSYVVPIYQEDDEGTGRWKMFENARTRK